MEYSTTRGSVARCRLGDPLQVSEADTKIGTTPADDGGQLLFIDTNAPLFPTRFYRALAP